MTLVHPGPPRRVKRDLPGGRRQRAAGVAGRRGGSMSVLLVNGNALSIPLADESVQCVVTSPPYYSLRDYQVAGQIGLDASPEAYVDRLVEVFREVWRGLRPDGTLWLNLGDSYAGGGGAGGG